MPKETEIADGLHVVKLTAKKNNASATIPRELCDEIGAKPGFDRLMIGAVGGAIVLTRATTLDSDEAKAEFERVVDTLAADWKANRLVHSAEGQR